MRSYAELEKEYEASKKKPPKGAEQLAKLLYIGGQYLEENKIDMLPLDSLQERAAAALQNYPQEERQGFAEAIAYIYNTMQGVMKALKPKQENEQQ